MENVEKALMVAAAVLMGIIIVSLGLYFYNQSNISNQTGLDGLEVSVWNQKFLQYEGKQKGSAVKRLLVEACIRTKSQEILKQVKNAEIKRALNGTREYGLRYPANIKQMDNWIKSDSVYQISFDYNSQNGRINEIWIQNF